MPVTDLTALSTALREVAAEAATAVGPMLREAFRAQVEVAFKRDHHDLVTRYDTASEEILRAAILRLHPDSRILGEEGGSVGDGSVLWLVDPIDGTANFARGIAQFCVSIAAAVDGELTAGVIYDPVAENLFAADLTGAWLDGRTLRSAGAPHASGATLLTDYPAARDVAAGPAAGERFARLVDEFRSVRRGGSGALALAHVAAGWADCTFGTSTHPWDIAAGALLVRQAGGSFRGYLDGAELTTAVYEAPHYAAFAGDAEYPQVTEIVRDHRHPIE
ncbi:inositol monophosphatase [Georgenia sp. EYE_87]|uniref:inositol monophosphatase family protein n=1 Tax=Georgenia sp. EYE_87 TaxID=2853448 RepID=UPI002002C31B|nr:inositol monophosphatase family protein [Georgenia sp. EYE_87]MCK6211794.1 inositol monophosphatase [Georgenia sp. EYE_87]